MRPRPIAVVGATAAAAIGATMAIAFKHRQFRRSTDADVQAVFSEEGIGIGRAALDARWDTLPVPIQRHLTYAITASAPSVRTARLRHSGTFRTGPEQPWSPIVGEQYFSAGRPGFVWFASMRVAPLVWIQARDRLVGGRGNMLVKPLSAFAIADASGPEIDQGAALRWLAESVWFPYSFAADVVTWETVDARSARASLQTSGSPVQAIFEVDADGRIARLHAERFRDLGGGRSVLTPWSGRYSNYAEFGGFRVPSSVEVTWDLTGGPFSYARFNVTALEYNVPEPF
jgi:hypothetical protein